MKLKDLTNEIEENNNKVAEIIFNDIVLEAYSELFGLNESELSISGACTAFGKNMINDNTPIDVLKRALDKIKDSGNESKFSACTNAILQKLNTKSDGGTSKPCDVTVNDPEVKKSFIELITSKIKDKSFDKLSMEVLNMYKLNKISIQDAINLLASKFSSLLTV